jgi:hypothetical protein
MPSEAAPHLFNIQLASGQRVLEFCLGTLMGFEEHHLYATVDAGFTVACSFN